MSFKTELIDDMWELRFSDEPAFVHALKMAPDALEPELVSGTWLVVAFGVWSIHDRQSVRAAIDCSKRFDGKFQLGIRPFDYFSENATWWPDQQPLAEDNVICEVRGERPRLEVRISPDLSASPLWLVLQDGRVLRQETGQRRTVEVIKMMRSVLGFHGPFPQKGPP
jgi:hypothetical protein